MKYLGQRYSSIKLSELDTGFLRRAYTSRHNLQVFDKDVGVDRLCDFIMNQKCTTEAFQLGVLCLKDYMLHQLAVQFRDGEGPIVRLCKFY